MENSPTVDIKLLDRTIENFTSSIESVQKILVEEMETFPEECWDIWNRIAPYLGVKHEFLEFSAFEMTGNPLSPPYGFSEEGLILLDSSFVTELIDFLLDCDYVPEELFEDEKAAEWIAEFRERIQKDIIKLGKGYFRYF